jgi:hypothetical protein
MEKAGVITKVHEPTDWVSSITFSRKANGKLRICLDPKDLNNAMKRTYHKTPTLEEITHKFHGATVFSKLDARHGYWSLELDDVSSTLTTFNSPFGRFKFLRLPFGLKISQDLFQERMDLILQRCPGAIGIADDVTVFGKGTKDHDSNLHNLMRVAREQGLVFNPDKCHIKESRVCFFGNYYDADGVHPDPEKVKEIHCMPAPQDVTELQQFLGTIQYMAPFIPGLAKHTETLRGLTKKDSEWQWTGSHQDSFDKLKSLLSQEMTLTHFDPQAETTIQVDASMKGLGAALIQNNKPVAFASKALTDAESRYANIERELLAVVFGCTRFHTYVYGSKFKVESDHRPLEAIQKKNLANVPPRLQRLMLRLQPYDFEITYKPGKLMVLADTLSRYNPQEAPAISLDTTIHAVHFASGKLEMLQQETKNDELLSSLTRIIVDGWPEEARDLPKPLRQFWSSKESLSVDNGLVLRGESIFIPKKLQQDTLDKIHYAHQGIAKCQLRAKDAVYWPGITKDIENMVKSCQLCQEYQSTQAPEPMIPHDVPQRPWHTVGTDLFHHHGSEYLIIGDYYSKAFFVRRIPESPSAAIVIQLTKEVFQENGIPMKVISDNGPQYHSKEYQKFAADWEFNHVTSSPGFPQSNGFIEQTIRTVKSALKKAREAKTDPHLALLSLRTTPIDASLPSPAEVLNKRKMRDLLPKKIIGDGTSHKKSEQIQEHLEERQQVQKRNHDRGVKELPELDAGQKVYVQNLQSGRWEPGRVQERSGEPRSYVVSKDTGNTLRRNRKFIRADNSKRVRFNQTPQVHEIPEVPQEAPPIPEQRQPIQEPPETYTRRQRNNTPEHTSDQPKQDAYQTRSGRSVVRPKRFTDD